MAKPVELDADAESSNNVKQRPITVALVDLDAGEDFIELVKSALLAALEALPPGSLFGLVAFSHKVRDVYTLVCSSLATGSDVSSLINGSGTAFEQSGRGRWISSSALKCHHAGVGVLPGPDFPI
eukprot:1195629-Prorocentrum_minimum.AAC.4